MRYTRDYFEKIFSEPDPWHFSTSPYEMAKYRDLLSAVPEPIVGKSVLEIGCAEGVFTELLAMEGVASLLAVDISPTAIGRAKERCARFPFVSFLCHDIVDGLYLEPREIVFCAEILCFMPREDLPRVCDNVIDCVALNGPLLITHYLPRRPSTLLYSHEVRQAFDATGRLEQTRLDRREAHGEEYELYVYRRLY